MITDAYTNFLASKRVVSEPSGFVVDNNAIHMALFDYQRAIVRWATQRGKAAVFADTGLGKTPIQLEWARLVAAHADGDVIILAPLAVAEQTAQEAQRLLGMTVTICRTQADVRPGINITNYEMLSHFDAAAFSGIVVDEASILKSFDGKTRKALTTFASAIPFRLVATATPAPNDLVELSNYAEFLDVMSGKEMLALFFAQDGNTTHAWRLKGHARADFWRWLASWAVAMRKPSDLGYSNDGFALPPLTIEQHTVAAIVPADRLFAVEAQTLQERQQARRDSTHDRVAACAEMVNASGDTWLIWCNLNSESVALAKAIPGAVEVTGSDTPEKKTRAMLDFAAGRIRVMVSKPSICGFGMNFQACHHVAFVGLSDSWEQFYQAIRRCWRFGQQRPVTAYIITSESEGAVVANIQRKEQQAGEMIDQLVREVSARTLASASTAHREEVHYREDVARGRDWTLYLGDSVQVIDQIASASVGMSIFSPPFPGMYAYTNTPHDMGNTRGIEEMLAQFRFLVGQDKLLRITMPGRMCCIHLTQSPAFKQHDGYVGLKDFRGDVIRLMIDAGWRYYGEVTIDKDPQVKAQRTKERGLMFKTLATDSSLMRMALADYVLYFMAPGENPAPIRAGRSTKYHNPDGWITNDEWIEWAHPVWYGIRETDVLNVRVAREGDDERHLCPLQLPVIERAVKLWSAPGETVFSPFAGIGSEGYEALKLHRKFIGIELKQSYWETARQNLRAAEREAGAATLWDGLIDREEVEDGCLTSA
jgi:DNA modification methylase